MTRSWTSRAAAVVVLGGLLAGCISGGATPQETGKAAQASTGCGGEAITTPVGGDIPSPACSHGPMTTDPPWPVSRATALEAAKGFVGDDPIVRWSDGGGPAWLFLGHDAMAVVDGSSGQIVEYAPLQPFIDPPWDVPVDWSAGPLPSPAPVPDDATAITLATTWVTQHGFARSATGGRATTYAVRWATGWRVALTGDGATKLDVLVTSLGSIAGVLVDDPALQRQLQLPLIDRDTAIQLALEHAAARAGGAVQQVRGAYFEGALSASGQRSTWTINTAHRGPDASDGPSWEDGFNVQVNAVDGSIPGSDPP